MKLISLILITALINYACINRNVGTNQMPVLASMTTEQIKQMCQSLARNNEFDKKIIKTKILEGE